MAIVQRFQRATTSLGERRERRFPAAAPDMEKLFEAVVEPSPVTATAPSVELSRDHDTACDLLDRAVSAFETLTQRSQELEAELAETKANLEAEASRHAAMTDNWTRLADGMRAHAHECEQRLIETTARAESAEAKAGEAMIRAEAAELQFANLQNRSTRLHDKVVASFGIGSRAQQMLKAATAQH
ncbi:MAG TPA: hypothetical protein VH414_16645 [Lichenihabitans sp.]|jgi:hypothetical protein|nr:hypothetical protein [Lichenihabitans sp.]